MKRIIMSVFFLTLGILCKPQPTTGINQEEGNFSELITHFENNKYYGFSTIPDTIKLPLIHANKDYKIQLSSNPVAFDIQTVVLENPFGDKFPTSFSVIYQNRLISLVEPGIFICHSIPSMNRDFEFEEKINTRKFRYHWLIDEKLIAISKNKYYFFDSANGWSKYHMPLSIKDQPVLFDDNSYLCFRDCRGEWGGTIYFFDKTTHTIHYTEATCANSVLQSDSNYFVLSHLGHGLGSSELKEISNPANLPIVTIKNINKSVNGQALGYTDKSKLSRVNFDYYNIQIFSSFLYDNRTIYMVYWMDRTFLAEIENNHISIINPLFNNELYTHDPITRSYGNTILINLDFYGIGRKQEVSGIIIQGNTLIKYDWNQPRD